MALKISVTTNHTTFINLIILTINGNYFVPTQSTTAKQESKQLNVDFDK